MPEDEFKRILDKRSAIVHCSTSFREPFVNFRGTDCSVNQRRTTGAAVQAKVVSLTFVPMGMKAFVPRVEGARNSLSICKEPA